MNYQSQTSLAVVVLFLYKLIVPQPPAKLRRKGLLKELIQIAVEIIHSLAGALLKAADVMEVKSEADLLQSATTVPVLGGCVVSILYVQQKMGSGRVQGSEQERFHRGIGRNVRRIMANH